MLPVLEYVFHYLVLKSECGFLFLVLWFTDVFLKRTMHVNFLPMGCCCHWPHFKCRLKYDVCVSKSVSYSQKYVDKSVNLQYLPAHWHLLCSSIIASKRKSHKHRDVTKPPGRRVQPDWEYQSGRRDIFMTGLTLKAWHITLCWVASVLHSLQVLAAAEGDYLQSDVAWGQIGG